MRSKTPGNSIPLYNFSNKFSRPYSSKPMGRSGEHDDGSSERHILPEESHMQGMAIKKTVVHEITRMERDDVEKDAINSQEGFGKSPG